MTSAVPGGIQINGNLVARFDYKSTDYHLSHQGTNWLTLDHLQQREEHGAIVDLVGESSHVRTVPVPDWVRQLIEEWLVAAGITHGRDSDV